jgi:hypothetical protein
VSQGQRIETADVGGMPWIQSAGHIAGLLVRE